MKIPITQSKSWAKLQEDLGEEYHLVKEANFQYLAIVKHTAIGNYLYCPYGPVASSKQSFQEAIRSLEQLGRELSAIFIRIEPIDPAQVAFLPSNTRKSKDINPKETWVLNLEQDEQSIIKGFSHGVRNGYNTASKKGLIIETTTDPSEITHLTSLQRTLAQSKNIRPYPVEYLKAELQQPFAILYKVKYQKPENIDESDKLPAGNQVIAASLFFDYEGTRYYMQSASDSRYKKLPATAALLANAIIDARQKGMKEFDFWGIAPEGASSDHPWYGFTKFKKSFGGQEKHYAGTYDLVLESTKYKLYKATRRLGSLLH